MFATQYNIQSAPVLSSGPVCGRFLTAPSAEGRLCEGGLRLQGRFKASSGTAPLVSVITAVHNGGRHIIRAMESVFAQTWHNLEYIVIDACSVDWTQQTLFAYGDAIDYFVSEPDGGLYDALNKGLALAAGDFVLILNADDWYKPEAVETLLTAVKTQGTGVSCGLAVWVDNAGNTAGRMPDFPFNDFAFLRCPLRHELLLVPARLYDRVGGYDSSYPLIADLEFMQRLRKAGATCHVVPKELMFFRKGGMSSDMEALLAERRRLLKANFPFLEDSDIGFLAEMTGKDCRRSRFLLGKYAHHTLFVSALQAWMRTCGTVLLS